MTTYAATGWQQNGSTYYYYDANGELHKGWLNTENSYYYLNLSTGKMTVGWEKINNKRYYFQGNGVMATGWVKDNGKYYYMLTDGTMHTGWVSIDNVFYYLGDSGAMATGWVNMDNGWYYFDPNDGRCTVNSAREIKDSWYMFGSDGKMVTGWQQVDGGLLFPHRRQNAHRMAQRRYQQLLYGSGQWPPCLPGGSRLRIPIIISTIPATKLTGWIQIDGTYYYLNPSDKGRMAANTTLKIDGVSYTFAANGCLHHQQWECPKRK